MSMAKKILIIGPSWVGDMVMAQGLFRFLKEKEPSCILHVLAPAWTFSLLKAMPEVAHAIEMPIPHGALKLKTRISLGKSLRKERYDQAIVLPNSFKSALIPWIANIPLRTGWRGEYRYLLLNDVRILDKNRYPLMIEQYLALGLPKSETLTKPYPYPRFEVDPVEALQVADKHGLSLENKKILALCAGAEFGSSKRWPPAYYAEIALKKLAEGFSVWLFGSPKDRLITDEIMLKTQNRCMNIAGQLQLSETIALLSLCSLAITNDSGLMHVAAALQKPLIAIYGSTSDAYTPPLSKDARVLKQHLPCQPCFERVCPLGHHDCMRGIVPQMVLDTMKEWGL